MSSYREMTWHPVKKCWVMAWWLANFFGRHGYGVEFDGSSRVFRAAQCRPPADAPEKPSEDTPT